MTEDIRQTRAELRSLVWIMRRVERLSPAGKRWLVDRMTADLRDEGRRRWEQPVSVTYNGVEATTPFDVTIGDTSKAR